MHSPSSNASTEYDMAKPLKLSISRLSSGVSGSNKGVNQAELRPIASDADVADVISLVSTHLTLLMRIIPAVSV